ncbi:MAG TPA: FAD binding domain-containing protein [Bradyrhizobium sp.]|nr:FAD binding domain-containing protein [Bradyrhizobium sp.]
MTTTNGSSHQRRAIVIGGSMSGLFAASLLRKAGWRTDVYERSDVELRGRGAGIVTHPDLVQSLERSGAQLKDLGITVRERVALDERGNVIERLPYEQIVTSWDRLHSIMRATIPQGSHHLGYNLTSIEQDAGSVTAVFENGERVTGDLLVGADGFRSVVRGMFAPEIQPLYAGYVVWRGLADEAQISKDAHAAIFDKFAFFLPPHNKNIGYPIAGPDNDLRPGHRRWNWVWYRAVPQAQLDDMLVDEDGVHHAVSIPPPKVRSDVIARLRKDAQNFLPPPMLDILSCVAKPFFTPIYDLLVDRMVYGRVALIGDAAAVARPHVGMGIAKAGTDAEVLADSLASSSDLVEGLARFERERLPIAARAVEQGRNLGEYMLDHGAPLAGATDTHWQEFHSIPGILKHTASSAFLRSAQEVRQAR